MTKPDDCRECIDRDDVRRIHQRLDEMSGQIGRIGVQVAVWIKGCEPCQRIVLGNGQDSIDKRLTRLETTTRVGGWFLTKLLAMASIVATLAGALVSGLWRYVLHGG